MRSARDDLDDTVTLPVDVTRVVSIVPSLTESIAVTHASLIVGATDYCTHPADLDVPRVRGTKNPDLAWAFLKHVTVTKWATRFSQSRKLLTGNVAADRAGLDYLRKDDPLGAQVLQTQLEHTDRFTGNWPLPFDAQLKDAFYPEVQNAVLGRKSAKQALADAERAVNRVLSRKS